MSQSGYMFFPSISFCLNTYHVLTIVNIYTVVVDENTTEVNKVQNKIVATGFFRISTHFFSNNTIIIVFNSYVVDDSNYIASEKSLILVKKCN